ncbi:MAG: biotin--[acetyl-CoA-carboxylase] ligase [Coriobacteriales bacterium]|jgi:BirA family biotin operon repressor/biotin-[acetyl-CoA-carboxylase] ligase|nr:biotin--[acetyl-CoA-carboxylase] ligase [Coriobacteriales bacterium]
MDAALITRHLTQPCHLVVLDSVDSTNDEVRRRLAAADAGAGAKPPLAVASTRQSAGRGRLGRRWESPEGGLYLSLALAGSGSTLPLVMALGVQQALAAAVPGLGIKWPNDLLCAQGKLCGILVEGPVNDSLIVGIGINIQRPMAGSIPGAAYLSDFNQSAGTEQTCAAVLNATLGYWRRWLQARCSFAPLAEEYRSRMLLCGEPANVRTATGSLVATGHITGIDDEGRLLLEHGGHQQAVAVGEVTLRDHQTGSGFKPAPTTRNNALP